MPCGWEGNRRSGVALAMRRRVQWFIGAQGLRKGDEHPAYSPHDTFYLLHGQSLGGETAKRTHTHTHTHTHV